MAENLVELMVDSLVEVRDKRQVEHLDECLVVLMVVYLVAVMAVLKG